MLHSLKSNHLFRRRKCVLKPFRFYVEIVYFLLWLLVFFVLSVVSRLKALKVDSKIYRLMCSWERGKKKKHLLRRVVVG